MPQSPTTNMLLVQPSENGDAGTWDTILTALFALIDAHDHSTGKGVTVKTAGISINADLAFSSGGNFFAAKDLKAVDLNPTAASGITSYSSALFANSTDSNNLYFRNSAGTNVRITNGSSLDITASGGIAGDYIATGAEVAYSDSGKEYTFKQKDPDNFWAALRSGPLRIAQLDTTESVYVEVIAPAALGGSYTITLPTAAPSAERPLSMSSAGVILSGHGNRETVYPASGAFAFSGTWTGVTGFGRQAGGAGAILDLPLDLFVGLRVRSVTFYYTRVGGTLTFALSRVGTGGTTVTTVSSTTVNTGTTQTSVTLSSIDHTILTANHYHATVDSGASGDTVYAISVTYDYP